MQNENTSYKLVITHSSLQCFQSCHRKYRLRYMDCIVPKQKSNALEFGSAMHIALEEYFKYVKASQVFLGETGACDFVFDCNKILTDKVEAAKLAGLLRGYIQRWYPEDSTKYDIIEIEREFKLRIVGQDFVGKIDGLVRERETDKYYILEHKTASVVDESYVSQKEIDSQTLNYANAIQRTMGIKISGAIHDLITKQKIRQKKGESIDDFCKRLNEDVTDDNFSRIKIEFTQEQMQEAFDELQDQISELWGCRHFYKCTGACLGRFGACDYLPICKAGGLVDALKEQYETSRAHEEISESTLSE